MDHTNMIVAEEELMELGVPVTETPKHLPKTKVRKRLTMSPTIHNPKRPKLKEINGNQSKSNCKVKFSEEMDLELLREICVCRPFAGTYKEVPGKWEAVRTSLGWSEVSSLAIRRRFTLLFEKFKTEENNNKQSSGQDEVYDEKMQLLTDIQEFMTSGKDLAEKENSSKEKQAEAVRSAALEVMTVLPKAEPNSGESVRKRQGKNELAVVFESKNKNKFLLKEKELDFKKEKFEKLIEQQEKDRLEREENRKLELRRIEALETANRNQHDLMMKLLEKITK